MAASFEARDPAFAERVRGSFARQGLMGTLGAELMAIEPGRVEIGLTLTQAISQQHGFVHGGAVAAIADSAAGYAALTLLPARSGVLTTEFKINLLAPASGPRIVARAHVIKPGRTLTLVMTEIFNVTPQGEKLAAFLTATLMNVEGREGVAD